MSVAVPPWAAAPAAGAVACGCADDLMRLGHDRDGHALSMLLIRERGWRRGHEAFLATLPDDELSRIRETGPRRIALLRERAAAAPTAPARPLLDAVWSALAIR